MSTPKLTWTCKKPIGSSCPADPAVPPWENIQLLDCMEADCPYLTIQDFHRIKEGEGG